MAIHPICDKCKAELKEFGGILLSPPDHKNRVQKFHLCVQCYNAYMSAWAQHQDGDDGDENDMRK